MLRYSTDKNNKKKRKFQKEKKKQNKNSEVVITNIIGIKTLTNHIQCHARTRHKGFQRNKKE